MKVKFFSSLLLYISHFHPSLLQHGSFNHEHNHRAAELPAGSYVTLNYKVSLIDSHR